MSANMFYYPHHFKRTAYVLTLLMTISTMMQLPVPLSCALPFYAILILPILVWKYFELKDVVVILKIAEDADKMQPGSISRRLIEDITNRLQSVDPNLQDKVSKFQLSKILSAMVLIILICFGHLDTEIFNSNKDGSGFRIVTSFLLIWFLYLVLMETYVLFSSAGSMTHDTQERFYQGLLSNREIENAIKASKDARAILKDYGFLVVQRLPPSVGTKVVDFITR